MLQGLRRKIGRYAPRGGVKGTLEEENEHRVLEVDATPMEAAVWQFTRLDKALKELESHLIQLLDQIHSACATMAIVAEVFAETCCDGECHGEDYKAATKQIEVQEAERMEQSIRFTVLDPLQARLERHGQLKYQLDAWEKLAAELKAQRAVMLKLHSSGLDDEEKRRQTEFDLHRVAAALEVAESTLLPQLENAIQSSATRANNLFSTTRLQTAIFFRNANQTVLSSLSTLEKEIVAEANPPLKFSTILRNTLPSVSLSTPRFKLSKMSSVASDGWTEVDGSTSSVAHDGVETISGSDEDDENSSLLVTIDDFESGRVAPQVYKREDDTLMMQLRTKNTDTSRFMTLASYPVVARDDCDQDIINEEQLRLLRRSASPSSRTVSLIPCTSRMTVSMLSSIGKTIRGKLSHSSGESKTIRQRSAPNSATSPVSPQSVDNSSLCVDALITISKVPTEWFTIEGCLWDIDARAAKFLGKSLLPADSITANTDDNETLYFECLSYLRVEDLARLSKVNFRLHSHLVDSAPIWKKCIRSGCISPAIRSSLWLSVFYESTPWRSSAIASHYLSADRRRGMYDQLVSKVGMKVVDGLATDESSVHDDDAQLAVWFREIDVDVVRTCHRIYDARKAVTNVSLARSKFDGDSAIQNSVAYILNEMSDAVARTKGGDDCVSPFAAASQTMNRSRSGTISSDLEAKMRRVLRAYVVYNPRVGYCQGMSFLVRLLADVAEDEADIFWLFVGFSEPENDRNLYEPGMAVLQPYLSKFEVLFSTHMPELFRHFQSESVHVATFCTRWFLTYFSSFETLAPAIVTQLLDIFIIDGWRIMFSVSLVILEELQQELLKCDMEGILRILKSPRGHMPEPDYHRQRQLVRHALAYSTSRTINSI
ncbi:ankyrin repeat-containing protein [Plasmopara halstedii]|uniref:Ankyrin repeat-containing protein n=1 Tax=Plasmopara halstedii TaxID=4781 RepID=A0A0P1APY6_PLAHL|nr:ankyrin repeat-containing protein [Plasmopara halstedii]CEG43601.1 ankyrin repeat-containing protein [Plasmopara halstedii]|eukprot:XP_024579970.1 ankyrin repeat-containing protein [Plasmopara halstedii]